MNQAELLQLITEFSQKIISLLVKKDLRSNALHAYHVKVSDDLAKILKEENCMPQLEKYLADNWEFVKGKLSYTARAHLNDKDHGSFLVNGF